MAGHGRGHDQSSSWGKKVGKNPTDRGKIGTKRSVLSDDGGVPIGLAVEGANRNDCKMVQDTRTSIPVERPRPTPEKPQGMCLDKGYDVDEGRELLATFEFTAHTGPGVKKPTRSSVKPATRLAAGW